MQQQRMTDRQQIRDEARDERDHRYYEFLVTIRVKVWDQDYDSAEQRAQDIAVGDEDGERDFFDIEPL